MSDEDNEAPSGPNTKRSRCNQNEHVLPQVAVVPTVDVASQFAALLCISIPRKIASFAFENERRVVLGNRKPQPKFRFALAGSSSCSTWPLNLDDIVVAIRTVWDWVRNEAPVRFFSVKFLPVHGRNPSESAVLLTFGVSMATLGVFPCHMRVWIRKLDIFCEMLGANQTHLIWCGLDSRTSSMSYWYSGTMSPSSLLTQNCTALLRECDWTFCVNHKWLVARCGKGVCVVNLLSVEDRPERPPRAIDLHGKSLTSLFMNKCHPDEVVLVLQENVGNAKIELAIFNLERLDNSESNSLVLPISSTLCHIPSPFLKYEKCLVLLTESKARAFIIVVGDGYCSFVLQYAEPPSLSSKAAAQFADQHNHQQHQIFLSELVHQRKHRPELTLSQLSDSIYCVSYYRGLEIWDCNFPCKALQVVEKQSHGINFDKYFGYGGFMFQTRSCDILVTDYATGAQVLRVTFDDQPQLCSRQNLFLLFIVGGTTSTSMPSTVHQTALLRTTMTEENNDNLPQVAVVPTVDVALQFAALLCISISRPRRAKIKHRGTDQSGSTLLFSTLLDGVSIIIAIKTVWDWVRNEAPVRFFSVSYGPQREVWGLQHEVLFTFAVSEATLGVFPRHSRLWVRERKVSCFCSMLGANQTHLIDVVPDGGCCNKYQITRVPSLSEPLAASQSGRAIARASWKYCVNHKWLVALCESCEVCVVNLSAGGSGQERQPRLFDLHKEILVALFMNKCHHDEVLLVMKQSQRVDKLELAVFNLEQLEHSETNSIALPLSSTLCLLPLDLTEHIIDIHKCLVLLTESKARAFIIMVWVTGPPVFILQYAESPPSSSTPPQFAADQPHQQQQQQMLVSGNAFPGWVELSQLSDRLYCVSHSSALEIWDYNFPSKALRVVESGSQCHGLMDYDKDFGSGGFMFHTRAGDVLVTDYATGAQVMKVTYHDHKPVTVRMFTEFSFLL
ncbi:hypothetical protein Pelo_11854 [Pelomyxa schiedti]|nr:hypothetical protein Pelo_11854 [Pelomyxa schiedti]